MPLHTLDAPQSIPSSFAVGEGFSPLRLSRNMPQPPSVFLERNQVLNRVVVDIFGWGGPGIVFARNAYERLEKSLDIGSWLLAGVLLPLLLDRVINRQYSRQLISRFPKAFDHSQATPLSLRLELLSDALHKSLNPQQLQQLAEQGLRDLPPALAKKILDGKLFYILLADLLLMATKDQGYSWGKNWLTEKLSGKKGFVGEFSYTENDYRARKAKAYEATRNLRMAVSLLVGYGSAVLLPLLLHRLATLPSGGGNDLVQRLKKLIPLFNYNDAIYMSKWIVSWSTFFNWNIPAMLSSRDSHELRENAVKTSVILAMYTLGDELISGLLAKRVDRLSRQKTGIPLLAEGGGVFGLPRLQTLESLYQRYGRSSTPYRLAVATFWIGLLGICAGINSALPVLNNYYTRKKVLREQFDLNHTAASGARSAADAFVADHLAHEAVFKPFEV